MQVLLNLSIALFAGLMLSRLAKVCKLPAVTAYLVAGILIGPYLLGSFGVSGMGFTSQDDIATYDLISEVALGFIAFSIGNEFRLSQLKKIGKQATIIGIFQAVFTTVLVDIALIIVHLINPTVLPLPAAIILETRSAGGVGCHHRNFASRNRRAATGEHKERPEETSGRCLWDYSFSSAMTLSIRR